MSLRRAAAGGLWPAPIRGPGDLQETATRSPFTLKTPWADGTTSLMLSPTELIEKLVALVPPPRRNLIRYHGVLAPAAADRAQIVPGPRPLTELGVDGGQAGEAARHRHRVEWARRLARVFEHATDCTLRRRGDR